jgi:alcohol dehydrogenase, propanol-preferring
MRSASLCHSDMMACEAATKPLTIGHEGVGHVVSFHPSAEGKGFRVSDTVGFLYILGSCFECAGCQVHNLHCETGKQELQGFVTDGFFAEYAIVDYHNAVVLDGNVWDLDVACATFCAGITAYHAIDSCNLKAGDWLGVLGCGGLGQVATQYAKAMGLKVVGIDIADQNLQETKKQGADAIFNSRTNSDYAAEIKKLTGGGVRAVTVFTNSPRAYEGAPSIIGLGGTLMVVGLPADPIPVSTMDLALGRYSIKSESTSIPQRMGKAIDFTAKHRIMPVVDVRGGLEELPRMVEEMQQGKTVMRTGIVFK